MFSCDIVVNNKPVRKYHGSDHDSKRNISYIEGREGTEYSIRIQRNQLATQGRFLAVVSVDGLSVMDGKPASDKSQGYIFNYYETLVIPGWRIDDAKVGAFKFGAKGSGKTYAEVLKKEGFEVDPANQGQIGIMIFGEYVPPPVFRNSFEPLTFVNMPMAYPAYPAYPTNDWCVASTASHQTIPGIMYNSTTASAAAMPLASGSLGTGFGKDVEHKTKTVEFKRKSAPDFVGAVVYDTISGLKKRGIIIENDPLEAAFPGMSNGCFVPSNRS